MIFSKMYEAKMDIINPAPGMLSDAIWLDTELFSIGGTVIVEVNGKHCPLAFNYDLVNGNLGLVADECLNEHLSKCSFEYSDFERAVTYCLNKIFCFFYFGNMLGISQKALEVEGQVIFAKNLKELESKRSLTLESLQRGKSMLFNLPYIDKIPSVGRPFQVFNFNPRVMS